MKVLGPAAFSAFLLTGCFPGFEELLVNKDPGTKSPHYQEKREQAFEKDPGTVFLADFNGKAVNVVTGDTGMVAQASFQKSLFGKGLRMETGGFERPVCLFQNTAPLSLTQKGTMEALIRTDAGANGFNHIIDKSWLYGLSNYGGKVAVHFGGGTHGWWYTSVTLAPDQWTYLAVTLEGTSLKLYVNGKLAESKVYAQGSNSTEYNLGIGNAADEGFNIPFKGIIDEVRLSKVVRSEAEIAKAWKLIEKKMGGK